jgi:hypothetical protein
MFTKEKASQSRKAIKKSRIKSKTARMVEGRTMMLTNRLKNPSRTNFSREQEREAETERTYNEGRI